MKYAGNRWQGRVAARLFFIFGRRGSAALPQFGRADLLVSPNFPPHGQRGEVRLRFGTFDNQIQMEDVFSAGPSFVQFRDRLLKLRRTLFIKGK